MVQKKKVLVDLEVMEISLVSAGANPQARVAIHKSTPATKKDECRLCSQGVSATDHYCKSCGAPFYKGVTKENPMTEVEKAAAEAAKAAEAVKAKADADAAEAAKVAKAAADAKAAAEAEVAKSDLAKAQTELAELRKSLVSLVRVGKVDAAKARIAITMKSIPTGEADLAETLVSLAEFDAELAKTVESILTKASALIEKGGLVQKSTNKSIVGAGSVQDRVDALVLEKRKVNKALSAAEAEVEVYADNPGLYTEYLQEKRA